MIILASIAEAVEPRTTSLARVLERCDGLPFLSRDPRILHELRLGRISLPICLMIVLLSLANDLLVTFPASFVLLGSSCLLGCIG